MHTGTSCSPSSPQEHWNELFQAREVGGCSSVVSPAHPSSPFCAGDAAQATNPTPRAQTALSTTSTTLTGTSQTEEKNPWRIPKPAPKPHFSQAWAQCWREKSQLVKMSLISPSPADLSWCQALQAWLCAHFQPFCSAQTLISKEDINLQC